MTIKCPYCGAVYDIEENECGCRARCEVCGKCFVIGHVLSYSEYRELSEPARSPIDVLLGGPKIDGGLRTQRDKSAARKVVLA